MEYEICLYQINEFVWRGVVPELFLEAEGEIEYVLKKLQNDEVAALNYLRLNGFAAPPKNSGANRFLKKSYKKYINKITDAIINLIIIIFILSIIIMAAYPTIRDKQTEYIKSGAMKNHFSKISEYLGINVCKK